MKQIKFPKEMILISFPWNIASNNLRLKESRNLCRSEESIRNALEALLISVHALSTMTVPKGANIPEELSEYWGFTAESIAQKAYTFDDLNYDLLQKVIDSYQAGPSSDQILEEIAEMWIWTTAIDIAGDILRWIRNNIDKNRDFNYVESLLNITSKYWQKVPHDLSSSLISVSHELSRERAFQLLEEVENTSSILSQRELARDYLKLLIESLATS
jgi:hypothetical protein